MADDRPRDRSLALRPTGVLAHPGQTPLHQRSAVDWVDTLTREECLQLVPAKVRDTVFERVGASIEWWATDLNDGITLVVFGSKALITVWPAEGRDGKAAFRLETIHLDDKSRRKARIQEVASARAPTAKPPAPPPPAAGPASLTSRMSNVREFLGQLPPRAQELMQEPFLQGTDQLDSDYLIFRHGETDASGGRMVNFWGYITDRRVLTLCCGVGHGYREGTGVASWDLNCWRVDTAPKSKAVTAR